MSPAPTLHLVHCVDTEGPLEEPVEATFDRLRREKGLEIEPSHLALRALQAGSLPLAGREAEIAAFVAPRRLAYLERWSDVAEMVAAITAPEFRQAHADPWGRPYCFTWFVIDVVGYHDNPRRKAVGWHVVWDHYRRLLAGSLPPDSLGWHFHVVPVGSHALEYNSCWTNNDWHEQALARRVIERGWFPSAWRAGGVIQRNDQSHWLEQFIPFDWSSRAMTSPGGGAPGSQSDWRGAPLDWHPYRPDFYDYRRPGGMRRHIFRCLDVDTPDCRLSAADVEQAFRQVRAGRPAVLAYTDHDRRDIRPDVERVISLVREVAAGFPEVPWRFANAHDAARACLGLDPRPAPAFTAAWSDGLLTIESDQPLFGPQPFLAVEEAGSVFYRDNTTAEAAQRWAWRPTRPGQLRRVGIGGANSAGATACHIVTPP